MRNGLEELEQLREDMNIHHSSDGLKLNLDRGFDYLQPKKEPETCKERLIRSPFGEGDMTQENFKTKSSYTESKVSL